MTDVENLVKALRCCADTSTMECSPECPRYAPEEYCGYRVRGEAADMIEKLDAQYEGAIGMLRVALRTQSNVDRLRGMSDEEWAEWLVNIWRGKFPKDCGDMSALWCDGDGGCITKDGKGLECSEQRLRACVLRWLRSPEEMR